MNTSGLTGRQRWRILSIAPLIFLLLVILGLVLLFNFTPFHSRVDLSGVGAKIPIARGSEIVFYGDMSSCSVYGSESGVYEKPQIFEIPRFIEGSWYLPRATVYNRYGINYRSGHTYPPAYAVVSCTNPDSRVWISGFDSPIPFTQNLSMNTRYISAAGAFFLAVLVLPFAFHDVRYVLTGKKSKRFSL